MNLQGACWAGAPSSWARRHRPYHGAPPGLPGRQVEASTSDAPSLGPAPQHRAVPGRLRHPVAPEPHGRASGGCGRLEAVHIAHVDPATLEPVPGTERRGLRHPAAVRGPHPRERGGEDGRRGARCGDGRPARVDNRLATGVPGLFACGNALHVHDLVDHASAEASRPARLRRPMRAALPSAGMLPGRGRAVPRCRLPP